MGNLVDKGAISEVGTRGRGQIGLDLNLWDIQRAVVEAAVQTSLALRREWRRHIFPLYPPASASRRSPGGEHLQRPGEGHTKGQRREAGKFLESRCFEQVCKLD